MRTLNNLKPHHRKSIEKLTAQLEKKANFQALILGGSITKGYERENSDIDIMIVIPDEEFQKRRRRKRLMYFDTSVCNYPDGYVDGKLVSIPFLKLVAEKGGEPARDAFRDAIIVFSKIPDLQALLDKIPIYQKEQKLEKIQKFFTQFEYANWALIDAFNLNNKYLIARSVSDLVLFGGRLILAHNEMLFPFHRWFLKRLGEAPDKPKNLMVLIDNLLSNNNPSNAELFYNAVKEFRKWETKGFWSLHFMEDTEFAWIDDKAWIGNI